MFVPGVRDEDFRWAGACDMRICINGHGGGSLKKFKFVLSACTTRTGLRLMHPAVALALEAWGKEIADKLNKESNSKEIENIT